MCCRRLLEVAGMNEDAPFTWTLSQEVKAVFAEVDESKISKDYERDSLEISLSENVADSLRHNPYVDSTLPPFEASQVHHTKSCDAFEDVSAKGNHGEHCEDGQLDDGLLNCPNIRTHGRCGSDPVLIHACEKQLNRVQLEPLNLSSRQTNKKKTRKGKNTHGENSKASFNNTPASEVSNFLISLKQNARLSTVNDRIQVAKSLASSACADSSVHSRTERIKVICAIFLCFIIKL